MKPSTIQINEDRYYVGWFEIFSDMNLFFFQGFNLGRSMKNVKSLSECISHCNREAHCLSFWYQESLKICKLKHTLQTIRNLHQEGSKFYYDSRPSYDVTSGRILGMANCPHLMFEGFLKTNFYYGAKSGVLRFTSNDVAR